MYDVGPVYRDEGGVDALKREDVAGITVGGSDRRAR